MLSTGNDIVALAAIDVTRTRQQRFYAKILSASEIALYKDLEFAELPFEVYVWLLWSVKEAAYKYLKRLNPALIFKPVKFVVSEINLPRNQELKRFPTPQTEQNYMEGNACTGRVTYNNDCLYFASSIYHELIHTIVSDNPKSTNIHFGIRYIIDTNVENQSSSVRYFAVEKLKTVLGVDEISIQKDKNNIPFLFVQNKKTEIPVSLAHHENWVAYTFRFCK